MFVIALALGGVLAHPNHGLTDMVDEDDLFIPIREIVFDKVAYRFSQKYLEATYSNTLKTLSGLLQQKQLTEVDKKRVDIRLRTVAYSIISAGQFAESSENLEKEFALTEQLIGAQEIPYGISWPDQQLLAAMVMSFQSSEDGSIDGHGIIEGATATFKDYLAVARAKIKAREKRLDRQD